VESPYEVLGVEPGVDEDTLNEAYRERVKEAHPDQGGTVDQFQRVQVAYEEIIEGYGPERLEEPDSRDGTDLGADTESRSGASARPNGRARSQKASPGSNASAWGNGQPRTGAHVEYLNYAVLDDHGWDLRDEDLFEKARSAGLDEIDYGEFRVQPRESLLEAAERRGYAWPFACRGGACVNCAVYLAEGSLTTRVDTVLPEDLADRGFQLSCNGIPTTPELKVVYNVKDVPELEDLLLPPRPFEQAYADD